MNPILPTKDEWTTYDYEKGAERVNDIKEGKYSFLPLVSMRCPGMPMIINFNDQMEYMRTHPTKVSKRLSVTGPDGFHTELKLLSREKTTEFATRTLKQWGREYAEKVLSATETGSLYFHMIHYFGSYRNFLSESDKGEPAVEKRRKI